jgi:hypothetical protein
MVSIIARPRPPPYPLATGQPSLTEGLSLRARQQPSVGRPSWIEYAREGVVVVVVVPRPARPAILAHSAEAPRTPAPPPARAPAPASPPRRLGTPLRDPFLPSTTALKSEEPVAGQLLSRSFGSMTFR